MRVKISAAHFERRMDRKPQDDDLERCNCRKAGQSGHEFCGWNTDLDLPNFIARQRK